jgi:tetratricopeptide (TPR) repeat protein
LLMRYLQGDALKPPPQAATEHTRQEEWQPAPPPTQPTSHQALPRKKSTLSGTLRTIREKAKRYRPKPAYLPPVRKLRITTAVFAFLLLFLLIWKGYSLYQLVPDDVYKKMYVPLTTGNVSGAISPVKYGIEQYYTAGNYVAVTLQSKKQPQLSEKEKLLTGLAYLYRDDYAKAIKWLEPAANNFKSPYRQQAEFYLALAYLKNEDYDRSIEKMEHIAHTPTHPYHNRVTKSLVRDVKMLKWR